MYICIYISIIRCIRIYNKYLICNYTEILCNGCFSKDLQKVISIRETIWGDEFVLMLSNHEEDLENNESSDLSNTIEVQYEIINRDTSYYYYYTLYNSYVYVYIYRDYIIIRYYVMR